MNRPLAQLGADKLKEVGDKANLTTDKSLPVLVGSLIKIFIGLLGIIFLLLTVYAGFLWLTARGEEDKVTHAKDLLKNAVIGLIIVSASYAIASFVISSLLSATKTA